MADRSACSACGKPRATSHEREERDYAAADPVLCMDLDDDDCAARLGGWPTVLAAARAGAERAALAACAQIDEAQRQATSATTAANKSRDALAAANARAEKAERDYLAVAEAAGIVYEADGHATKAGPVDAVVDAIREDKRKAVLHDEALVVLGGRLRSDGSDRDVVTACEQYVAADDAVPGDFGEGEEYSLSGAVAWLRTRAETALRELDEVVAEGRRFVHDLEAAIAGVEQRCAAEHAARQKVEADAAAMRARLDAAANNVFNEITELGVAEDEAHDGWLQPLVDMLHAAFDPQEGEPGAALLARLSDAEKARDVMVAKLARWTLRVRKTIAWLRFAPSRFRQMSEDGDGYSTCEVCELVIEEPHAWKDCFKQLRDVAAWETERAIEMERERDEARRDARNAEENEQRERTAREAMEAEAAALRKAGEALRDSLDKDRSGLADALGRVVDEVKSRAWVADGRGCYAWDDDRYKQEAGEALRAVQTIAQDALKASGNLFDNRYRAALATLKSNAIAELP